MLYPFPVSGRLDKRKAVSIPYVPEEHYIHPLFRHPIFIWGSFFRVVLPVPSVVPLMHPLDPAPALHALYKRHKVQIEKHQAKFIDDHQVKFERGYQAI